MEKLSKKQECSALTSNLGGKALNCVMAKRRNESDSAWQIFYVFLTHFSSGVQGHQTIAKFEKKRQSVEVSIDKFLDDLELLRRRIIPGAIALSFMDGVRSDELKTMLATHFTLSADSRHTPDDLRMKLREYLLIKPRAQKRYSNNGNYSRMSTGTASSWYKTCDDMDKRSSCANCGSLDQLVSAFSIDKQSLKAIGFFFDDMEASNEDHEDYVKKILLKFGPRCFLATLKGISNQTALSFGMQYQTQRTPATKRRLSGMKASRAS